MNEINITTSQNVNINFNLAGFGERFVAQMIDMLIRIAYVFVVFYSLHKLNLYNSLFYSFDDSWSKAAIFILLIFPALVCGLVQEIFWDGQTVGKKLLKIKVIKIDGYQASVGDYFMRFVFRIVEVLMGFGIIAIVFIAITKKAQRLGDIAAGTALISLKSNINISHTILQELKSDFVPTYPAVIKLSDNDVRIIKETFENSLATKDQVMIRKLKNKIVEVTGINYTDNKDITFIKTVLADFNYYTQKM